MDTKTALRYALEYLEKAQEMGLMEDCVRPLSTVLPKLQAAYDFEIDKAEREAEAIAIERGKGCDSMNNSYEGGCLTCTHAKLPKEYEPCSLCIQTKWELWERR